MKIVLDTNTVLSGLLWHGAPRRLLDLARSEKITLYTSVEMLSELDEILHREKFSLRLARAKIHADDLVLGYAALATVILPQEIQPVIYDDPDDDMVLACALTAHADFIISGDHHLLDLGEYKDIEILDVNTVLSRIF